MYLTDQWCLGPHMELAVFHSSHHYWLVLCPQPGVGSVVWVSKTFCDVKDLRGDLCFYKRLLRCVFFFFLQGVCQREGEGGEQASFYETAPSATGGTRTERLQGLDRQGRYCSTQQQFSLRGVELVRLVWHSLVKITTLCVEEYWLLHCDVIMLKPDKLCLYMR